MIKCKCCWSYFEPTRRSNLYCNKKCTNKNKCNPEVKCLVCDKLCSHRDCILCKKHGHLNRYLEFKNGGVYLTRSGKKLTK